MKKFAPLAVAILAILATACNGKLRETEEQNAELKGDLRETLATQDSLFALLNDISDGMTQIKELERIASSPSLVGESASRKDEIRRDMEAIQAALQERRQRLDQLEQRIRQTNGENAQLTRTIATLRNQLADQQTEIATLTNQLAEANIQISRLGEEVSSLNQTVDTLNSNLADERTSRQNAEVAAENATNELNTVYYCLGSKQELKNHGIIQSGFLRRTRVMAGDIDQSYFTAIDRRNVTDIPTHARKAKVLTSQPSNTYEILTDAQGQKVIHITDPTRFWQQSNYLVIQTD